MTDRVVLVLNDYPPVVRVSRIGRDGLLRVVSQVSPLSPNSRAHWRTRNKAKKAVADQVALHVIALGRPQLRAPVEVQPTYVVPDARGRDSDNYTALLKPVIDQLVRSGVLPGGDTHTALRPLPPAFRVEKGARRLELVLRALEGAR